MNSISSRPFVGACGGCEHEHDILKFFYVKTKESGPFGGRAPDTPPGSAVDVHQRAAVLYISAYFSQFGCRFRRVNWFFLTFVCYSFYQVSREMRITPMVTLGTTRSQFVSGTEFPWQPPQCIYQYR